MTSVATPKVKDTTPISIADDRQLTVYRMREWVNRHYNGYGTEAALYVKAAGLPLPAGVSANERYRDVTVKMPEFLAFLGEKIPATVSVNTRNRTSDQRYYLAESMSDVFHGLIREAIRNDGDDVTDGDVYLSPWIVQPGEPTEIEAFDEDAAKALAERYGINGAMPPCETPEGDAARRDIVAKMLAHCQSKGHCDAVKNMLTNVGYGAYLPRTQAKVAVDLSKLPSVLAGVTGTVVRWVDVNKDGTLYNEPRDVVRRILGTVVMDAVTGNYLPLTEAEAASAITDLNPGASADDVKREKEAEEAARRGAPVADDDDDDDDED